MAMATRKVLIGIDNSANGDYALNYYVNNIYREGHEVTVLHIAEPPHLPAISFKGKPFNVPHEEWSDIMLQYNKKEQDMEEKYTTILRNAKLPVKDCKYLSVNQGDSSIGHCICKQAKDSSIDMIVIGSRGMNAIRRTFLGSVSDYVLHHFGAPVLIIPMKS